MYKIIAITLKIQAKIDMIFDVELGCKAKYMFTVNKRMFIIKYITILLILICFIIGVFCNLVIDIF